MYTAIPPDQVREAYACIEGDPDSGHVLGDNSRFSGSRNTTVQSGDKPQIQYDVEDCRYGEECERDYGVSQ